ncbi:MAG: hypothetical protein AAF704_02530 [Cyanobacteria bacterium P01_D01_bin.123]
MALLLVAKCLPVPVAQPLGTYVSALDILGCHGWMEVCRYCARNNLA